MRRLSSLLAGLVILALTSAGCEGPEGPAGPAGPAGATGPAGPAGPPGADGNATCGQCHVDNTDLFAKQLQYAQSFHYTGGDFERSTAPCAACHTHEGFMERLASGEQTAGPIANPTPPNCRTCHQVHTTYTDADWALTTTAAVDLWAGGQVDFGKGNLCAQCHQARPLAADQTPVIDGPPVTITSRRYGYHHSPVAQVLGGTGGFEFAGSMTIAGGPSTHGAPEGCPKCHMAEPVQDGVGAGGHTLWMESGGDDFVVGCNALLCHGGSAQDFDLFGTRPNIDDLMDQLYNELLAIGIIDPAVGAPDANRVAGTWPANVAAAVVNWQMVLEDKSRGLHNPPYVRALLTNTIEKMAPLVPVAAN